MPIAIEHAEAAKHVDPARMHVGHRSRGLSRKSVHQERHCQSGQLLVRLTCLPLSGLNDAAETSQRQDHGLHQTTKRCGYVQAYGQAAPALTGGVTAWIASGSHVIM